MEKWRQTSIGTCRGGYHLGVSYGANARKQVGRGGLQRCPTSFVTFAGDGHLEERVTSSQAHNVCLSFTAIDLVRVLSATVGGPSQRR